MSGIDRERCALAAVLAALAIWALAFVWLNREVIAGTTYWFLFDDALISMSYARNLIAGHGLNWARYGAPVEGFTNPLWVAAMLPIEVLPVTPGVKPLLVQLLSLACLLANVAVIRLILVRHFAFATGWWLPATIATAAYFPLNLWGMMGMETSAQALLTSLALLFACDALQAPALRLRPLAAVVAAALLLRMDNVVLGLAIAPLLLMRFGVTRDNLGEWLRGGVIALAPIAAYTLFRWLYFAELWPNTYHLKMTGLDPAARMLRGWLVAREAFDATAWLWLPVLFASFVAGLRHRQFLIPACVLASRAVYVVYVGGDAYEDAAAHGPSRFFAAALPTAFVLANALANLVLPRRGALEVALATALVGLAPYLPGAEMGRRLALLAQLERSPHQLLHMRTLREILALRDLTANSPTTRVATMWAGMPGYYSDWQLVDIYGYNDRVIARGPDTWNITLANAREWMPGHNKSDLAYTIRTHRPDWFLHMFPMSATLEGLLVREGYRLASNGHWTRTP
jgi:hypothetical protein